MPMWRSLTRPLVALSLAALAASTLAVAPAGAVIGPGSVLLPGTPLPPVPGTSRQVDVWKLVGTVRPTGYPEWIQGSASQIAPQWAVLTLHNSLNITETGDSIPGLTDPQGRPVTSPWEFRNELGTARIERLYRAPDSLRSVCPTVGNKVDLALARLATPIAPPPGGFPLLLDERLPDSGSVLPGHVLSVGNGRTEFRAVWTTTDNVAVNGSSTRPTRAGTVPGDSGGAAYWFPNGTSRPVLANVLALLGRPFVGGSLVRGEPNQPQLASPCGSQDVHDWVRSTLASHPGPLPEFTSPADLVTSAQLTPGVPRVTPALSPVGQGVIDVLPAPVAAGGTLTPPATARYTAIMIPPSGSGLPLRSATVPASSVPVSGGQIAVPGVAPGVDYTVLVQAVAADGRTSTGFSVNPMRFADLKALTGVSVSVRADRVLDDLNACVDIAYTAPSGGDTPEGVGVLHAAGAQPATSVRRFGYTPGSAPSPVCGLSLGTAVAGLIAPIRGDTMGPGSLFSITTPPVPTAEPINLRVAGPDAAGCFTVSWETPVPGPKGGTLTGFNGFRSALNAENRYVVEQVTLPATARNWRTCGGVPGASNTFTVEAAWSVPQIPDGTSVSVRLDVPA